MKKKPCCYCFSQGVRRNGYYEYPCSHCGGTGYTRKNMFLSFVATEDLEEELNRRQQIKNEIKEDSIFRVVSWYEGKMIKNKFLTLNDALKECEILNKEDKCYVEGIMKDDDWLKDEKGFFLGQS